MDKKEKIIKMIRELNQNGRTFYRIHKDTGFSKPSIARWAKGEGTPSDENFDKILDYYNSLSYEKDEINLVKIHSSDKKINLNKLKKLRDNLNIIRNSMQIVNMVGDQDLAFTNPEMMDDFRGDVSDFFETIEKMYQNKDDI